jgi:mRNA interferase RelE/StbE
MKELAELPRKIIAQLDTRIRALADNPRPPGCKALKGKQWQGLMRVRSGNYRIVYSVADDPRVVTVVKIGDRKDVYE